MDYDIDYNKCANIFHAFREPERISLLKDLLKGTKSLESARKSVKNAYSCLCEFEDLGFIEEISDSKNKNEFVWKMYDDVKPYINKVLDDFDKIDENVGSNPIWSVEEKYVVASMLAHCLSGGERLVVFNTILNSLKPLTHNEIQEKVRMSESYKVGVFCRDFSKLFFVREMKAAKIDGFEHVARKNEKAFYVSEPLKKLCKPIFRDVNALACNTPHKITKQHCAYGIPKYYPKHEPN